MIDIGFTGTQLGMTREQAAMLRLLLSAYFGSRFHHGDCIGADAEAHDIAEELGLKTMIHPPTNPKKRAFKKGHLSREPKEYKDRNADIVRECDPVLACPNTELEIMRSGTWMTIRMARRVGKHVIIIRPDGGIA